MKYLALSFTGSLILSFMGSLCPALLYNLDMKKAFWAGLSGSVGWLTYIFFKNYTDQVIFATFMGAIAVSIYSETLARLLKTPATILSVSGILPLVPGSGAYNTVQYMVQNRYQLGLTEGIKTMASAGSIALGIMIISALFRISTRKLKL